ncbi:MAG: cytochrome C oxidase subunit IV family protein [Planctomycetota bacterium]
MAITKDSGVRNTGALDLTQLGDEDRKLVASRDAAAIKGLRGIDVPANNEAMAHDDSHHVAPLWIMYGTFAALMMLTAATVGARFIDLTWIDSSANIVLALSLAFLKSLLVAMFFMHLWWDTRFNQMVLVSTLFFLTVFIGFAIIDTDQYQPIIKPVAEDAYAGNVPEG